AAKARFSLRPESKDSHKQVGYTYAVLLSVTQKVVDLFEVSIYGLAARWGANAMANHCSER
ncbi:hypothetical protein KFE26_00005, partial [Shewanella sp. M16]|uniref:hypothetical protein n=1 Tax=Shewanella sp. M16 TaxID=2830837 RepID=UPI001BAFEC44